MSRPKCKPIRGVLRRRGVEYTLEAEGRVIWVVVEERSPGALTGHNHDWLITERGQLMLDRRPVEERGQFVPKMKLPAPEKRSVRSTAIGAIESNRRRH